jgi:hypothetical protein
MATASAVAKKLATALMKAGEYETLLCVRSRRGAMLRHALVPMWNLHFAGHMRGDSGHDVDPMINTVGADPPPQRSTARTSLWRAAGHGMNRLGLRLMNGPHRRNRPCAKLSPRREATLPAGTPITR